MLQECENIKNKNCNLVRSVVKLEIYFIIIENFHVSFGIVS